jgi:Cytochrome P450
MPYTGKGKSLPAVFNTRDEATHKQIKNPIAPLFSLSNTLTLEPFVNRTLDVLLEQINARFTQTEKAFDLAEWLQYFAFDVMGTLTLSRRYGFLEQGEDVNDMLVSIWNYFKAAAPVSSEYMQSVNMSIKIINGCIHKREKVLRLLLCSSHKFHGSMKSGIRIPGSTYLHPLGGSRY